MGLENKCEGGRGIMRVICMVMVAIFFIPMAILLFVVFTIPSYAIDKDLVWPWDWLFAGKEW